MNVDSARQSDALAASPEFELDLDAMAFGGEAIGRVDGQVVFVPYALPGERVRVAIERAKKGYSRTRLLEVLRPGPERVAPPCPNFGACGGCQYQHVSYPAQLRYKQEVVVEQLQRIGGFADAAALVRPTLGMVAPWEYRNHARFSLGRRYGELGFTRKETHRLLRIDYCWLMVPQINRALDLLQRRCRGLASHQVTIRQSPRTGQLLVQPAIPEVPELPTGQPYLEEELLGQRFRVAPSAFFQINTRPEDRALPASLAVPWLTAREGTWSMAELLALTVLDRLGPAPLERVVDAYCGVGTFAVLLAGRAGEVVGIEESPAAVRDARHNAAHLPNVRFEEGKTEEVLPRLTGPVNAVVLDPARVGCHPAVLDALLALRPPRLVYVSCDPATLARDLKLLVAGGYALQSVEPLDLFPQTAHVESVSLLQLR
jgi:23S rRNA (uracil1939-C5)-methyltransferase